MLWINCDWLILTGSLSTFCNWVFSCIAAVANLMHKSDWCEDLQVVRIDRQYDIAPPIPDVDQNYHRNLIEKPWRSGLKPLNIVQPEGPSFTVEGNLIKWQKWQIRVSFNAREGLVLHNVGWAHDVLVSLLVLISFLISSLYWNSPVATCQAWTHVIQRICLLLHWCSIYQLVFPMEKLSKTNCGYRIQIDCVEFFKWNHYNGFLSRYRTEEICLNPSCVTCANVLGLSYND